ncbi:hypothetical protein BDV96DRAFT_579842 [Lophiotrema nucula]|uniref:M6 metalloprotease n=1 Tax=Lophiotrema nucula TaxID=690887 RepID=A0A6A5Z0Y8_9PLEO|nr:hypothetical protein BDV96DRAFT_579842 [Lophiotrema nucula]
MRPSWIPPVLTFALLSPVLALPHGGGDFCQRPPPSTVTVTSTTTLVPGYVKPTGPHQNDNPHQHDVPVYTRTGPDQHGVPTYTPASYSSTYTSESNYPTLPPYPVYNSTAVGPTGTAGPTEVPWPPVKTETSSVIPEPSSSSIEPVPSASCRPSAQYFDRVDKAPSVGTLRAAFLFVDFPDFPATTTVQDLFADYTTAPSALYKTMSYGKLTLEPVLIGDKFHRMPLNSADYNMSRGFSTEEHLKYINDGLTAVGDSASFENIDILYVLPPPEASTVTTSAATASNVTTPDNFVISNSITFGQDLYNTWGYKTLNHETGHTLGLPDLYPYDGRPTTTFAGGFDLMGLVAAQSPDFLAWHKWYLGWIEDSQVDCVIDAGSTTHRISPIEIASDTTKAIAIPLNETAYIFAEVRSKNGIDDEACGTGLLLYIADPAVERKSEPEGADLGSIRVIDTKPKSVGCGKTNDDSGVLNDAPLLLGESWDTELGIIVTVKEVDGDDYVVEVEKLSR